MEGKEKMAFKNLLVLECFDSLFRKLGTGRRVKLMAVWRKIWNTRGIFQGWIFRDVFGFVVVQFDDVFGLIHGFFF
jgi:hypothetical protein